MVFRSKIGLSFVVWLTALSTLAASWPNTGVVCCCATTSGSVASDQSALAACCCSKPAGTCSLPCCKNVQPVQKSDPTKRAPAAGMPNCGCDDCQCPTTIDPDSRDPSPVPRTMALDDNLVGLAAQPGVWSAWDVPPVHDPGGPIAVDRDRSIPPPDLLSSLSRLTC